jgi:phenylpyruvate tautomerase PptA (4-oxalocrotonate tautomerase family)
VPYLQLDVPQQYPTGLKRSLARRLAQVFADIMQTTPDKVVVAFRELNEGSLWRCGHGEPERAAVLKCDIRRGRPAEQRASLAAALVAACVEALHLDPAQLSVEFTQHAGDEVFRAGIGLGADWTAAEAQTLP